MSRAGDSRLDGQIVVVGYIAEQVNPDPAMRG